jgi:hypothetical protein
MPKGYRMPGCGRKRFASTLPGFGGQSVKNLIQGGLASLGHLALGQYLLDSARRVTGELRITLEHLRRDGRVLHGAGHPLAGKLECHRETFGSGFSICLANAWVSSPRQTTSDRFSAFVPWSNDRFDNEEDSNLIGADGGFAWPRGNSRCLLQVQNGQGPSGSV